MHRLQIFPFCKPENRVLINLASYTETQQRPMWCSVASDMSFTMCSQDAIAAIEALPDDSIAAHSRHSAGRADLP
jgi:hypothetical protein